MEMDLKMPCPVCVEDGNFTKTFTWYHSSTSCPRGGGRVLQLDDTAIIRCPACQRTWSLLSSLWGCPVHSGHSGTHSYEYKHASYSATVDALSYACRNYKNHPGQAWYDRLMRNL
jgi:hypothetical protein